MMNKFKWSTVLFLVFVSLSTYGLSQENASEKALLSAIQANPNDSTAHFNLGISYMNDQKFNLAFSEFKTCLDLNSKDDRARELMESCQGISAYFKNNFPAAVDHFQKALAINPQNPNAGLLIADCYIKLKDYDRAESALKTYAQNNPDGKEKASEDLAKLYVDQKKYPEAIKELKNMLEVDSHNIDTLESLGVAYFQMKDYQNAVRYWESAIKLQQTSRTFRLLGFSYYNLGNFTDAIRCYQKSIQLETSKSPQDQDLPSLADTYFNLAVAYNDNAFYDEVCGGFSPGL